MLSPSESASELNRLRERVYGIGANATEADIARLRGLESGPAAAVAGAVEEVRIEVAPVEGDSVAAAPSPSLDAAPTAARRPPGRWRVVLLVVTAALAAALAFAAGIAIATPPAAEEFPELSRPQTEDDVFPVAADDVLAASVDLTSARFIARLDGSDVFLAHPGGGPGLCLLTRDAGSSALLGGACASETEAGENGVSLSTSPGLEIVAGDIGERQGVPIELSESVTAYRR